MDTKFINNKSDEIVELSGDMKKHYENMISSKGFEVAGAEYFRQQQIFENMKMSPVDVCMLGDSLIARCQIWNEMFPDKKVANRGISGDGLNGLLARKESVYALMPKKIFCLVGVNDLYAWKDEEKIFIEKYEKLINSFQKKLQSTEIFVQSILPNRRDEFDSLKVKSVNEKLFVLAKKSFVNYIDLYPHFLDEDGRLNEQYTFEGDGIHLNAAGYAKWYQIIKPYVYL